MSIKITDKVRGPQVEGPSTEPDDVPAVAQKAVSDSPGRVESSTDSISIAAERLALGEITRDHLAALIGDEAPEIVVSVVVRKVGELQHI